MLALFAEAKAKYQKKMSDIRRMSKEDLDKLNEESRLWRRSPRKVTQAEPEPQPQPSTPGQLEFFENESNQAPV